MMKNQADDDVSLMCRKNELIRLALGSLTRLALARLVGGYVRQTKYVLGAIFREESNGGIFKDRNSSLGDMNGERSEATLRLAFEILRELADASWP